LELGTLINAVQQLTTGDDMMKCSACSRVVGSKEDDSQLIRLYKWDICVQRGGNMAWESYEAQNFLCARLRASIANEGTRKFIVYSAELEASTRTLLVGYQEPSRAFLG
jgi:hypothetical protein